jgi:hypothetical protein
LWFNYLPSGDVPSEVMSSSTISKAEENARLKDLEETFEERYTKVKYHINLQTEVRKGKESVWESCLKSPYKLT